ncbi:hypothetical protein PICSAR58_02832 [Mycobacterium avium subsp. paratuberculosis]|nr:hypothetical protein PICSAR58_02832 [Mycobacterium avium subsp. paratuberculosis]CAG7383794.1 hypothetical protein PICSAR76_03448 [Mycobacterium avium subsp. paratuberculosis]
MHGLQVLTAAVGGQRQPDLSLHAHRVGDPSPKVVDTVVGQQRFLHGRREHPAIGAGQRIPAFGQGQGRPVGRVGEQRVLEIPFAPGEQRRLGRDDGDAGHPVPEQLVEHRRGRLSTADHRDPLGADPVVVGGAIPELGDRQHPRIAWEQRLFGLAGAGDHQRVGVHGGFVGVQRPAVPGDGQLFDLAVHHGHPHVVGHPGQILAPPAVRRRRPAAVDPFGERRRRDQIGLPAVAGHPLVQFGVAARHQRRAVGEADVLFRAGTQPVRAVGPAAAGLPVRRHADAFHRDHVGNLDTHVAQHRSLGGHRHGLGSRAQDRKCAHVTISRSESTQSSCSAVISVSVRMSGRVRHCAASTRCPPYVSTIAAMVSSWRTARSGSGIGDSPASSSRSSVSPVPPSVWAAPR